MWDVTYAAGIAEFELLYSASVAVYAIDVPNWAVAVSVSTGEVVANSDFTATATHTCV